MEEAQNAALLARCQSFEKHLIVERGLNPRTAQMRFQVVRRRLSEWQTLTPTKAQVQDLKEKLVLAGFHRDYVGNICRAFADYGRFIEADLKVKSPAREPTRVPRWLTEQEVQSILFVIDSIRDRALFYVLSYSGVRVFELCNLKLEDVNFEKKTVNVQLGKGGKSEEIPIAQPALDALKIYLRSGARKASSPWLFQSLGNGFRGGKLTTQSIRVLARRYALKGGVKKAVSPHMFRHALATNMIANGCPLPIVQKQLRHSRVETTMRYLHLSDKAQRENYEKFLPAY